MTTIDCVLCSSVFGPFPLLFPSRWKGTPSRIAVHQPARVGWTHGCDRLTDHVPGILKRVGPQSPSHENDKDSRKGVLNILNVRSALGGKVIRLAGSSVCPIMADRRDWDVQCVFEDERSGSFFREELSCVPWLRGQTRNHNATSICQYREKTLEPDLTGTLGFQPSPTSGHSIAPRANKVRLVLCCSIGTIKVSALAGSTK